ncbi:MAG: hypothetical protein L0H53_01645 [Candidatus Nitrosocosmicus sp.]|nr:hypothetical protein [Candidatus Nitrosocosmicus sp.]MDN5867990.1 hypothetical protein [Candidatus Nitrosocosmicus sp.]
MNRKLLDILVCPFDKVSTLELMEFKTLSNSSSNNSQSSPQKTPGVLTKDEVYTNNDNENNQELQIPCSAPSSEVIKEGLLLCRACLRFYPITEEIPIILPDELRDKKKDLEFLNTWSKSIPEDLLKHLKPWTV